MVTTSGTTPGKGRVAEPGRIARDEEPDPGHRASGREDLLERLDVPRVRVAHLRDERALVLEDPPLKYGAPWERERYLERG